MAETITWYIRNVVCSNMFKYVHWHFWFTFNDIQWYSYIQYIQWVVQKPLNLSRYQVFLSTSFMGQHPKVTTGSTCVATCGAPGYTYSGSPTPEVFECLATGEFQGQNPSCAPLSCQNLTLSSQYEHNCRGMLFQDACAVSCAEGYTITGPASQYICGESGTIQGTLPSCTPNPCTNTISPEIFQTSGCDGVTTGQSCNVSCQPGMIPNSAEMSCHSSGFLVGALPSCLPAKCPANSALEAASVAHNCQNASFGQSCSVYCAAGYKLTQGPLQWEEFQTHIEQLQ